MNPEAWGAAAAQSRAVMWDRLRMIIATQLGVSPERVTPEATFVGDLGMD